MMFCSLDLLLFQKNSDMLIVDIISVMNFSL